MADRIGQTGEGRQRQEVKETRRQETGDKEKGDKKTGDKKTGNRETGEGRQKKRDRRWETEDGRQRDERQEMGDVRWFSDVISGKKLYF